MDITSTLMAIAWTAIFVMLVAGALRELGRLFVKRRPLPFFAMMKRHGLTYAQLEHAVGTEELVRALRRCGDCPERWDCGRAIACPNEPLFSKTWAAG